MLPPANISALFAYGLSAVPYIGNTTNLTMSQNSTSVLPTPMPAVPPPAVQNNTGKNLLQLTRVEPMGARCANSKTLDAACGQDTCKLWQPGRLRYLKSCLQIGAVHQKKVRVINHVAVCCHPAEQQIAVVCWSGKMS